MDVTNTIAYETIATSRFTSEDLLAIMGGFDGAWFACPPTLTGPDDPGLQRKLDRWRRKAVRRFAHLGIVDEAANPSPELEAVLRPLADPSLIVANEEAPEYGEEIGPDRRTAVLYILPDRSRATLVGRAGGLFGGFRLRQIVGEDEILGAVLGLNGVGGRLGLSGLPPEHRVVGGDPEYRMMNAALEGRPSEVISECGRRGLDPTSLLAFARWWEAEGRPRHDIDGAFRAVRVQSSFDGAVASTVWGAMDGRLPTIVTYAVLDQTSCTYGVSGGIGTGSPEQSFPVRASRLFTPFGIMFSVERSPQPGDPPLWWDEYGRKRDFGSYDVFASEDELARRLLTVDANPCGKAV